MQIWPIALSGVFLFPCCRVLSTLYPYLLSFRLCDQREEGVNELGEKRKGCSVKVGDENNIEANALEVHRQHFVWTSPQCEQSSTERNSKAGDRVKLKLGKMAMLKRQGLGLMRALLVLVGVSALCGVALGTRRENASLDHRGHRHRHSGMMETARFSVWP